MDSNIIAAIIGVGASILVFIATIIAEKVAKKNNDKNEIVKIHSDELCKLIIALINIINETRFNNKKCIDNICEYSKKEVINDLDKQTIMDYNYLYLNNMKNFLNSINNVIDYIEIHEIVLFDYINYKTKLKKINVKLFEVGDRYFQFNSKINHKIENLFLDDNINILKSINNEYDCIFDELYFYYYNLNVKIQNNIYSKYFKNKRLEKIKNDMYENIN